jgi:hypothetical protein
MLWYKKDKNKKWTIGNDFSCEYMLFLNYAVKMIDEWVEFEALDEFCEDDPYGILGDSDMDWYRESSGEIGLLCN